MEIILSVENLSKTYESAGRTLTVLENINFEVEKGTSISIVGPSGSGKTTLLGLCAGLDRASSGQVKLNDTAIDRLSEDERAR
ncbi:MAG TPA: ATP-binding cassette domain-containing protein, partial [Sphingobacteriaceae bacterium]